MQGDVPRWSGQEEKIFVSVRVRPLNEKEISSNDVFDWECINDNAIRFKHTLPDRAMLPAAYTFGNRSTWAFMLLCGYLIAGPFFVGTYTRECLSIRTDVE